MPTRGAWASHRAVKSKKDLTMYRVGLPFWKTAARFGVPVKVRVCVHFDPETKSYWTTSPDLDGLTVTGNSLDELFKEAMAGMHTLLDMELNGDHDNVAARPQLSFSQDALCAA